MIVSLAIFTVVALIAVGALLKITDANKKSQTLKSSINNINFALESMSREMRVGSSYSCSGACSGGDWTITFKSSKTDPATCTNTNLTYAYKYIQADQALYKAKQVNCTVLITSNDFAPLTAPEVKITDAQVKVFTGPDIQSYAWFHFKGYAGIKEKTKSYFDIQTSVSQRLSD